MNPKYYKCCAVPQCKSTTIKTPEKLFIHLPLKKDVRKKWLQLARRDPAALSLTNSRVYFCEDHFDLPNDMENYIEYRVMGSVSQVRMKVSCLPTKFECQPDRKRRTESCTTRPLAIKRQRLNVIKESEKELEKADAKHQPQTTTIAEVLPGTSSDIFQAVECEPIMALTTDKSIQVFIKPKFRSKSTQTTTVFRNIGLSPAKGFTRSCSTSLLKWEDCKKIMPSISGLTKISKKLCFTEEQSDGEVSLFTPSVIRSDSSPSFYSVQPLSENSSINEQYIKQKEEEQILQNTINKIKKRPRFYIGVPKSCYFLIDIISKHTDIPEKHVLMCLKKIRLDSKLSELADEFVMSVPYASKIFFKNIPAIAGVMHAFIVKLNKNAIRSNLPMSFRHKYHYISCIIDCLEIEIQKPSNAVNQALTWSDYKKANTVKYLISSTPDGLINYISPGYGGRISDMGVVENCNFLDCLESGDCVMADRGFKHIEQLLLKAGLRLVRPPSVSTGSKLSKQQASQTKQIANLRIHIERVIRRLREFAMLKPHACINNYLLKILDEIVVIACSLINLQDSYIK